MHTGSCLCANVKYEVDGEISEIGLCHCRSCRKASGSAFGANAGVDRASFKLLSGADTLREYASSPGKIRAFCSRCGSPIYAALAESPDVLRIRLGALDHALCIAPARAHVRLRQGGVGGHRCVLGLAAFRGVGAARRARPEGLAAAREVSIGYTVV